MATDYKELRRLECKHDGQIPRDELDRALGKPTRRAYPANFFELNQARGEVTVAARELEQAHFTRRLFDKIGADWPQDKWDAEDDRTAKRLKKARDRHDAAVANLTRLQADTL